MSATIGEASGTSCATSVKACSTAGLWKKPTIAAKNLVMKFMCWFLLFGGGFLLSAGGRPHDAREREFRASQNRRLRTERSADLNFVDCHSILSFRAALPCQRRVRRSRSRPQTERAQPGALSP